MIVLAATDGTGWWSGAQDRLASPTLAFVLVALGLLALSVEAANPGIIGTGVGGVVLVLLGLVGLAGLPVTALGLVLVLVAGGLFAAEVTTPGTGLFAAGGVLALAVGGLVLVESSSSPGVPATVALPLAAAVGIGVAVVGRLATTSRNSPSMTTGEAVLVGREVTVGRRIGERALVFVNGSWWQVDGISEPGAQGRVIGQDGLVLVVEPLEPERDD